MTQLREHFSHEEMQSIAQKKWDLRYLGLARYWSQYSKDPSTKVGAVVVAPDNSIVSLGYNGLPRGVLDSEERLLNRDLKYKLIRHGEMNAMAFANRPLDGCTLYTFPFMPCPQCAGEVIQRKISRVVSVASDNERWLDDFKLTYIMLNEAGVSLHLYPAESV